MKLRAANLLLVLCIALAGCSTPGRPSSAHPGPSPHAPGAAAKPTPSGPGSIDDFVPVAERYVEEHRGLKFKSDVKVTAVADAEFRQRLAGKEREDEAAFRTEAKVLGALGLLTGHPDLAQAQKALASASVIGYYDPKSKELVVRGVEPSPGVRRVVVHELTHALQDQWFAIDRPVHPDDESDLAFSTLVEGDAVRIEKQYVAGLSEADRKSVRAEELAAGGPPPDVPGVLLELTAFPYVVGPRFTQALIDAGGQARLDAAFSDPPTTTAQVLHPDRFLAGAGSPPAVDAPAGDGAIIDRGVVGEFGLRLIMERLAPSGQISDAEQQAVALGWSGDRYVAWESGDAACVRTRFVMSGPSATGSLVKVLENFARGHVGTTIQGGGPILFTSCG
ncbi:MAG: hypothetical protein M3Z13_05035 [Candidatus Dormibacteraeota bacterium]|nr:hypothetical protein [Candidatus Dormibacteraeota bacterium]